MGSLAETAPASASRTAASVMAVDLASPAAGAAQIADAVRDSCRMCGNAVGSGLVHTVVETPGYLASADRSGMTEAERAWAVNAVAANPTIGDLIVGSGGCRKLRVPRAGGGKSGGYRVITYYAGPNVPVFLMLALAKAKASNFSAAQINALAKAVKALGGQASSSRES